VGWSVGIGLLVGPLVGVGRSVGQSVGWSVGLLVGPLVSGSVGRSISLSVCLSVGLSVCRRAGYKARQCVLTEYGEVGGGKAAAGLVDGSHCVLSFVVRHHIDDHESTQAGVVRHGHLGSHATHLNSKM